MSQRMQTNVGSLKLAMRLVLVFIIVKLDWKFPVGAGLLGIPGGPSHF